MRPFQPRPAGAPRARDAQGGLRRTSNGSLPDRREFGFPWRVGRRRRPRPRRQRRRRRSRACSSAVLLPASLTLCTVRSTHQEFFISASPHRLATAPSQTRGNAARARSSSDKNMIPRALLSTSKKAAAFARGCRARCRQPTPNRLRACRPCGEPLTGPCPSSSASSWRRSRAPCPQGCTWGSHAHILVRNPSAAPTCGPDDSGKKRLGRPLASVLQSLTRRSGRTAPAGR